MNWIGCNCPDHSRDTTYAAPALRRCQPLTLLRAKAKKGDGRKYQFREDKYYWRRKARSRCWSIGFNMCQLLMWWKLHHGNNIYLKWSQCFFFNLNTLFRLCRISSKTQENLMATGGSVSWWRDWENRRERSALWSRDAETGNKTQQQGTIEFQQTGGVAGGPQKKCCFSALPSLLGSALSSAHHALALSCHFLSAACLG